MQDKSRIFMLFACCIPVLGARRSTICDLQRQTFRFIPNGLHEILTEHRGKTVAGIEAAYGHEYDAEIAEYFEFLIAHELGFWCDDPDCFPEIDLTWKAPERITNAILDVDAESRHDFDKILRELDDLGCKALQIRFYDAVGLAELERVLELARYGRLRSIDLLVRYSEEMAEVDLEPLLRKHGRLSSIVVHSAPEDRLKRLPSGALLSYRTKSVDSPHCCGEVHPRYFVTNIGCFSEAQKHNTCLNKKISVDTRGEIKNCPSLARSFGNIRTTSLHNALAHRDFRELWSINKDRIDVCRDCEFRYVCTDCRAYIAEPQNLYSKPSKCTYDPYTAAWRSA
ncbi:MAG: grasp-with-spasm system SPASM domain peptide maturase [Acidobacteria bacterium]|nr:grasp-with-spasm system SPASM domain peptide maturase [Acidobacteriota bacterium]